MDRIELIEKELSDLRNNLANHKVYKLLTEIDDIRIFMRKHVYAVWDFMSLLKSLQSQLTCISIPWKPVRNPKIARFINEIVLGEESDVDDCGIPKSHFEIYLEAMQEIKADTSKIMNLINALNNITEIELVLKNAELRPAEKSFLNFTFDIVKSNEAHKIASAFTFGREDLIPDMFVEIINKSNGGDKTRFPKLTYYLERHVELDGDEHGPLSLEMIQELCGDNSEKWDDVLNVAKAALIQRINLWDDIAKEIEEKRISAIKIVN